MFLLVIYMIKGDGRLGSILLVNSMQINEINIINKPQYQQDCLMSQQHFIERLAHSLQRLQLQSISPNLPTSRVQPPLTIQANPPNKPAAHFHRKNRTMNNIGFAKMENALNKSCFRREKKVEQTAKQNSIIHKLVQQSRSCKLSSQIVSLSPKGRESSQLLQMGEDTPNGEGYSSTNDMMDNKFDQFLELDLQDREDILDIESKFIVVEGFDHEEIQLLQPEIIEERPINTHEQLLEEENQYIREQLIQFVAIIEAERSKMEEFKHKNKDLKRENFQLKEDLERVRAIRDSLQQELIKNEEQYYGMSSSSQSNARAVKELRKQRQKLEEKLQHIMREYVNLEQRFHHYQHQKEKEIQNISEERNREKENFTEDIAEKDKEINELNECLKDLKKKMNILEDRKQDKEERGDKTYDATKQENFSDEEIENKRSNSICLSLAEAESLKNIIEEKEMKHQKEIQVLKIERNKQEEQYREEIDRMNVKILQFEAHIQRIEDQWNHRSRFGFKQSNQLLLESRFRDYVQTYQMEQIQQTTNLKALQQLLLSQREEKLHLMGRIRELQDRICEREDQEDLDDLLEKCLNELQRQRSSNLILKQQIDSLRRYRYISDRESRHLFD